MSACWPSTCDVSPTLRNIAHAIFWIGLPWLRRLQPTFSYLLATTLPLLAVDAKANSHDSFSRDKPRFSETLDVIKFLCKDLWTLVFRKQIDNLKTNHRGIYVLTDQHFKPLTKMSLERGTGDNIITSKAQPVSLPP